MNLFNFLISNLCERQNGSFFFNKYYKQVDHHVKLVRKNKSLANLASGK